MPYTSQLWELGGGEESVFSCQFVLNSLKFKVHVLWPGCVSKWPFLLPRRVSSATEEQRWICLTHSSEFPLQLSSVWQEQNPECPNHLSALELSSAVSSKPESCPGEEQKVFINKSSYYLGYSMFIPVTIRQGVLPRNSRSVGLVWGSSFALQQLFARTYPPLAPAQPCVCKSGWNSFSLPLSLNPLGTDNSCQCWDNVYQGFIQDKLSAMALPCWNVEAPHIEQDL